MKQFVHSGDLGDVIYSLPTIKAMGGGNLWLMDMPGVQTMHGMTRQRFEAIRPLVNVQPYIHDVYGPGSPGMYTNDDELINLNQFRSMNRDLVNEWLPNHYLDVHGIEREAAHQPWLTAEPRGSWPVLIARSARYHNPRFPWRQVLDKYRYAAAFIGTPAEHAAFNVEFDASLPYERTTDLLDAARAIAGCYLFIGNQSCPLAIAEGLKKPIVCEVCPYCPNCISPRSGFCPISADGSVWFPDLESLCHTPAKPSAATSTPTLTS